VPQIEIPQTALDQLNGLAKLIHEAHIRSEAHAKATHERFNVFTTLLSEYDEVRLHTRLLHCLLDPEGFHDCGPLFLDLFLATLDETPGLDHKNDPVQLSIPPSAKTWTVRKERACPPYGQIDLLMERPGFGIAIENKINAGEQPRQLGSYATYLRNRFGSSWLVLYLTVDGKRSETHDGKPYCRISYREHILLWVDKCLRETYHIIPINQTLLQYRAVVRAITGKTMESSAMKELSEFITKNPDIIRYSRQINEAIGAARADFLDRLADGVTKELQSQGFSVRLRTNLRERSFGKDANGALIITPPPNSPLHQVAGEIWVENCVKYHALIIGIESHYDKPPLSELDELVFKEMNQLLEANNTAQGYRNGGPKPTWGETYWPVGWHDLITWLTEDGLAKYLEKPISEVVSSVSEDIKVHITLLEQIYAEAVAKLSISHPSLLKTRSSLTSS
jgi:hypothetical protein